MKHQSQLLLQVLPASISQVRAQWSIIRANRFNIRPSEFCQSEFICLRAKISYFLSQHWPISLHDGYCVLCEVQTGF